MSGMRIIPSADQLDVTDGDEDSRTSSPSVRLSADRSIIAADRSIITATQQLEEATDRFRHYLLYGHKKVLLLLLRSIWGGGQNVFHTGFFLKFSLTFFLFAWSTCTHA